MKKILVPRVRFKEFGEEWKEERLLNFIEYKNGRAHENFVSKHGEYILVNSKFISSEGMSIKKVSKNFSVLSKNTITLVLSDIPNGKALAKTFIIPKDNTYALNQRIAGLTIKKGIDLHFINKTINRNPYFLRLDDGINQTNLNINQIKNMRFYTTDISEQQKIGKLLDQISNLITLEQSKLNKLKQVKETLLQKMFPEGNSKTPRIRFKAFDEEWKEERLEETVNILDNLRIPVKESLRSPGAYKYYGANGIQGKINGYTHQGENILIAEDGANDLNNYPLIFEKNKIWVNNHTHVVTSNNPNLLKNYFLYLSLKKVNFSDYILGTQRYKLTLSNLKEVLFVITKNIDEQQKIGDFFSNIDTLINLYNSKLNKLKQIKYALLQKMFI
ncbi:restriction endonuclease subunit S [Mycoplasmopsis felis]|uniref:restriction endonuclease subunit S n=1 Tax=Mycoplasmopsis felis TaxID=33923 RepID=UPI002F91766E